MHPRGFLLLLLGCVVLCEKANAADRTPWEVAIHAMEEGRYELVVESLADTPDDPEVRYLRARAHAELGEVKRALELCSELPDSFPALVREDFARLRVQWASDAGDCAKLNEWSSVLDANKARRLNAECAFYAGNFAEAEAALKNEKDLAGRALYVRALAKVDPERAREPARLLYLEAPAHREAATFRTLAFGETEPALSVEEHIARAEAWISARRFSEAVDELKDVPKPKTPKLEALLWHTRGEALFRVRSRYDEAMRAYERAARLGGDTEAHDAFHAVRSRSRAGDDKRAIVGYEKFAKKYPKSELAADALYLAGFLRAREKQPGAVQALERFLESAASKQQPSLRRDAMWDLAWLHFEANNGREAERVLKDMPPADSAMERARVHYWRAKALALESKDSAETRSAFRRALYEDPLDWYAQLSARALHALGDPWPEPFQGKAEQLPKPTPTPPADVLFYRRLGLVADAARASARWSKELDEALARVVAHTTAGNAVDAHALATSLLPKVMNGAVSEQTRWLWEAAFPKPYAGLVSRETQRHHLPEELFFGHMQVESRYRPHVISGADAIGLMQILPSTAAKVAERSGLPASRSALERPYVNVSLGAAYLSELVTRYEGQVPAAIAAYNAGSTRVDGWLKRGPSPLDRWVETIPVEQTRNYVRRVVTAWSRYHYLAAPDDPWGLPLPEHMGPRD